MRDTEPQDLAANDVQELIFVFKQRWSINSPEHCTAIAFEQAWPQPTQAQVALRAARQKTRSMERTTYYQIQIPMRFNKAR